MERYSLEDQADLENIYEKAVNYCEDPLENLLHFIRVFRDIMDQLTEPYPGCLYASYSYQSRLFDEGILEYISKSLLRWRAKLVMLLEEVLKEYQPKIKTDVKSLADQLLVVVEEM